METLALTNPEEDNKTHSHLQDIPLDNPKSEDEDSEIYLEADDYLPKGKDTIVRKPIQKPKGKKKYHNISNEMRLRLIDLVEKQGFKIKHAAKKLAINYSSAKSICQIYKREGRTNKKVIKKNFENDDSTPDNDEYSLSLVTSKEESESSSTKRALNKPAQESNDTKPAKKVESTPIIPETVAKIIIPEDQELANAKLVKVPTVTSVDFSKVSNPIQNFMNSINQAKNDNISPNKFSLDKRIIPQQLTPNPMMLKSNANIFPYSNSSAPIIIQQSNFSPYQPLNYNTQGFIRQVNTQQNSMMDTINMIQSNQVQSQHTEQSFQPQQMMPQGPMIVVGNNFPSQMNSPYFIANSPNMLGSQQLGGFQVLQPVFCVMPQQSNMMYGYQQGVTSDSNVVIQSQQVQQQVQHQIQQPQSNNFGMNSIYQNFGMGKQGPNLQYILMKSAEDPQLLQKK